MNEQPDIEYMVFGWILGDDDKHSVASERLNSLATEGWRLFSTMLNPGTRYCYYHLEREKR